MQAKKDVEHYLHALDTVRSRFQAVRDPRGPEWPLGCDRKVDAQIIADEITASWVRQEEMILVPREQVGELQSLLAVQIRVDSVQAHISPPAAPLSPSPLPSRLQLAVTDGNRSPLPHGADGAPAFPFFVKPCPTQALLDKRASRHLCKVTIDRTRPTPFTVQHRVLCIGQKSHQKPRDRQKVYRLLPHHGRHRQQHHRLLSLLRLFYHHLSLLLLHHLFLGRLVRRRPRCVR